MNIYSSLQKTNTFFSIPLNFFSKFHCCFRRIQCIIKYHRNIELHNIVFINLHEQSATAWCFLILWSEGASKIVEQEPIDFSSRTSLVGRTCSALKCKKKKSISKQYFCFYAQIMYSLYIKIWSFPYGE